MQRKISSPSNAATRQPKEPEQGPEGVHRQAHRLTRPAQFTSHHQRIQTGDVRTLLSLPSLSQSLDNTIGNGRFETEGPQKTDALMISGQYKLTDGTEIDEDDIRKLYNSMQKRTTHNLISHENLPMSSNELVTEGDQPVLAGGRRNTAMENIIRNLKKKAQVHQQPPAAYDFKAAFLRRVGGGASIAYLCQSLMSL